jgi:TRAP-type C4-dicarboxylate transport system substrate-binding protein
MKVTRLLISILLSSILLASAAQETRAAQATRKLRLGTWANKGQEIGQATVWWADEVKKRTNGALEIEIYFDSALCSAKETLPMTRSGAIDIGGIAPGYHPQDWPLMQGLNDSHQWLSKREENWVEPKIYDTVPALKEELKANNVVHLTYGILAGYGFMSREPIRKLDDLKGKRIRTWGSEYPKRWTPYGAVPTTILMGEAYEGMAKGTLDVCPMNKPSAVAFGFQEVAKYFLDEPLVLTVSGHQLFMNLDVWNSLSPEIQQTLLQIKADSALNNIKILDKMNAKATEALKAGGIEFTYLSDTERERLEKEINAITARYLTDHMAKIGKGPEGKILWNELMRLRKEYLEWLKTAAGKEWLKPKE